ncbi:MAG: GNAT family N-acetyltransferase [Sediminibacterium sp.]
MQFKWIKPEDELLVDVKILGKQNARTLGMFPDGAFDDHAERRRILACVVDGRLGGYVLFRITQSKRILYITHLCIHPDHRKKGIAKKLLDEVKEKHGTYCNGFGLSCREDYEDACKFWERYGFKPKGRQRSRAKEEHYLINWYYDFGNPDLFSAAFAEPAKINAVLDSNIIIKMRDELHLQEDEVLALRADWLLDEVEYFYAQEIFVEINRDTDRERGKQTRAYITHFQELPASHDATNTIYDQLATILTGTSDNDISDRKQLAECIASGTEYFITLDKPLLSASEQIQKLYNVKTVRPAEFILNIDYLRNHADYRSYRVAGARFDYHPIVADDMDSLAQEFVCHGQDEKINQLKTQLHSITADISNAAVRIVKDGENKRIGFFALSILQKQITVKVIRHNNSKIGKLLFQQMIGDIFSIAVQKKVEVIVISDSYIDEAKEVILISFGFHRKEGRWIKILLQGQYLFNDVLDLPIVKEYFDTVLIKDSYNAAAEKDRTSIKLQMERFLSPAKLLDLDIPTYIIPIKPRWASQLFDHHISSHELFGSNAEQAWRKENIYYRSTMPITEIAPGRILWYLSSDEHSPTGRTQGVSGFSYLDEVYTSPAKLLYQKFKDFGIYEWRDISGLTKGVQMKEIRALLFSDTEVFEKIVPYKQVQEIFTRFQRSNNTFASPVKVGSDVFNEIYRIGKQKL